MPKCPKCGTVANNVFKCDACGDVRCDASSGDKRCAKIYGGSVMAGYIRTHFLGKRSFFHAEFFDVFSQTCHMPFPAF